MRDHLLFFFLLCSLVANLDKEQALSLKRKFKAFIEKLKIMRWLRCANLHLIRKNCLLRSFILVIYLSLLIFFEYNIIIITYCQPWHP